MTKPTTTFPVIAGKKIQLTRGGEGPPLLDDGPEELDVLDEPPDPVVAGP